MPIYRKGDDQFELEHRALLESSDHKYPRTAIHVLRPDVTLKLNKAIAPHHVPATEAPKDEHYKDDWGNDITITNSPGYMTEDFPVSGLDVARANAKAKKGKK